MSLKGLGACSAMAAVLALGGWTVIRQNVGRTDYEMRSRLLDQAGALARAVDPNRFAAFSFTGEDRDSAEFLRLRDQLTAFASVIRCRSLYTMALRDGALVPGPASRAREDPGASPHSPSHRTPAPEFFDLIHTGIPFVAGPVRDEFGEYLSAAAPVFDPKSGRVTGVIALEIEAADWRAELRRARRDAGLSLVPATVAILGGLVVLAWRRNRPAALGFPLRSAEAWWIAAVGLALTRLAAIHVRAETDQARRRAFEHVARLQTDRVGAQFRALRDHLLSQVVRFHKGSEHVDPGEFRVFVAPLIRQPGIGALGWGAPVAARDAAGWEAEKRNEGPAALRVRPSPDGSRDPLFLLRYFEPAGRDEAAGYDLGSDPEVFQAIGIALQTGLPTAAPASGLPAGLFGEPDLLVVHPVPPDSEAEPGFALATLRLEPLLQALLEVFPDESPIAVVSLYRIRSGQPPAFLACSHPRFLASPGLPTSFVRPGAPDLTVQHPLFVFGHTYALAAHPGPAFWAAHPGWAEPLAWIIGLGLTLLAAAGTLYAIRRRALLEGLVEARTADERAARGRIEESESFTRLVLDHLPIGIAVNSLDPVIPRYMNDEFARIYRASRESLQDPDAFWEAVYPDPSQREQIRKRVLEDCASGDPDRMQWEDVPLVRKGEETTYVSARNIPVPGQPLVISTVWDVTERVRHAEERRGTVEFLQLLVRPTGLTEMLRESAGWLREWTGCDAIDIRLDTGESFGSAGADTYPVVTALPLSAGSRELGQLRFRNTRPFRFAAREAARLARWTHSLALAIRQRQDAEALRNSQRLSRIAGRVARLGGWSVDRKTERIEWSDEVAAIHGKPPGTSPTIEEGISFYAPECRDRIRAAFSACLRDGTPFDEELQILDAAGRRVWVRAIGEAERDEAGNIVRVSGAFQDISDRMELEQQLRQAQKLESVGRLAGGVAHDFNNMLQTILGNAELLLDLHSLETAPRELIEEIRKAAYRSADLTRQLLAFSRRQTIRPRVLDVNRTVEDLLKMLRRLLGEGIDLAWKPGPDLWSVRMDPTQVDQVLANLAVNARDAMNGVGKLAIETSHAILGGGNDRNPPEIAPGSYVVLSVSDNGPGIDPAVQEHIFEPFFTTKPAGKGTGLGLATVFGIVRQNEGYIHVHSHPKKGTTFRIYLPRHEGEVAAVKRDAANVAIGGQETILLVEDEPGILAPVQKMLKRFGYSVLTALSPEEALHISAAHPGQLDLLLTDVIMPGMNGRGLWLRLSAARPELRCLFMSGYTADGIARQGILERDMPFLQKPFSPKELARAVRAALDRV